MARVISRLRRNIFVIVQLFACVLRECPVMVVRARYSIMSESGSFNYEKRLKKHTSLTITHMSSSFHTGTHAASFRWWNTLLGGLMARSSCVCSRTGVVSFVFLAATVGANWGHRRQQRARARGCRGSRQNGGRRGSPTRRYYPFTDCGNTGQLSISRDCVGQ